MLETLITKLKESRSDLMREIGFLYKHKFPLEAKALEQKIYTIDSILDPMEGVQSGRIQAEQVNFNFDN